jgi:hypothetical protein
METNSGLRMGTLWLQEAWGGFFGCWIFHILMVVIQTYVCVKLYRTVAGGVAKVVDCLPSK